MYIMGKEEVEAVRRVIESKVLFRYGGGECGETDKFEREWSDKIGVKHTIAMTSGTAALICAMAGLGIGPGDEVIVPAYTFMATALAPLAVGAVPVLAEIDESLTLDPQDFERKITPRTKAVAPVDMCGLPCDMDAIMEIAGKHNILVVEDACQALGGAYRGRRLGSIGDVGAFSFNQYKIITCGEGGAMVTNSAEIYERALIQHDGGCAFREHASDIGTPFFAGLNFRINEILSAILRVQLTRLDGILSALRDEKRRMMEELASETVFSLNPINDTEGECATTLALLFESPETVRSFLEQLGKRGVSAYSPINSDRHVYSNWEPVMQKRGAHHPARDPLRLSKPPLAYSPDMCPTTLSVLERTVYLSTSPTRSDEELKNLLACVKEAAARA